MNQQEREQLLELLNNPELFIGCLEITAEAKRKPFTLWSEQQQLLKLWNSSSNDLVVLKPRQVGISTMVCALFFYTWYTAPGPTVLYSLSHTQNSAKQLMSMYKGFYNSLPQALKRKLKVSNGSEMTLADTGASIRVATAGGEQGLRSFTANYIHMSELAFYKRPEDVKAQSWNALAPGGRIVLESTANHEHDALWVEIQKAKTGQANWDYIFFAWSLNPKYSINSTGVEFTTEELDYASKHSLTADQLYWRRKQIEKLGMDKFQREYPMSLEEAYTGGDNVFFAANLFSHVTTLPATPQGTTIFEEPIPGIRYAIGVDTAAGVGRDNSTIYVVSEQSMQPVYRFASNTIQPSSLADLIQVISNRYNNALTLVENNNHGGIVLERLRYLGFTKFYSNREGKEWTTSERTKAQAFQHLRKLLFTETITTLDERVLAELKAFEISKTGTITYPEQLESHGDSAIGLLLAYQCILRLPELPKYEHGYLPDWVRAKIIKRTLQNTALTSLNLY